MTQSMAPAMEPQTARPQTASSGKAALWELGLLFPLLLYLGTVLFCAPRLAPDGYDGVGFVLALDHFDLSHFQPQPPGYPLFVMLGRLLRLFGLTPVAALSFGSALLLGAGLLSAAALVFAEGGATAGWLSALLLAGSPLCWALGTSTLSDAAGLGAVLLAVAVGIRLGLLRGGLLFGLALGLRPSLAPLLLPLFLITFWQAGGRGLWRGAAGLVIGGLLWSAPLLYVVGPKTLLGLSLQHLHGHIYEYGGTVATDVALFARLAALGKGMLFGAFGPAWPLCLGGALFAGWRAFSKGQSKLFWGLLFTLLCWSVWVLIAQQPRGSGRHLLPAAVALILMSSLVLGPALKNTALRIPALILLTLAVALPSARMVQALRTRLSGGAQLAAYVFDHYPTGTALYGGRKARYLDWLSGPGAARPALYLGDVIVDLEHRDHPPAQVLLTSEVRAAPASRPRLRVLGHFCTPDAVPALLRLDQQVGDPDCLDLFSYQVWP
jgi:hypothetical protein